MSLNPLRLREPVIVPDRPPLTKAQKTAIWNRENGLCWYCLKPVAPEGSGVIYDHKTPRELNGSDALEGIFPIHTEPCNRAKTYGEDIPRIAKAKRQERLTRAKVKKPGGFRGWRRFDGTVVRRGER